MCLKLLLKTQISFASCSFSYHSCHTWLERFGGNKLSKVIIPTDRGLFSFLFQLLQQLVKGETQLKQLSQEVNADLRRYLFFFFPIRMLEEQVASIAEVAHQNSQRLELLFLKEKGL